MTRRSAESIRGLHRYRLYGQTIASDVSLGNLPRCRSATASILISQESCRIRREQLCWYHSIRLPISRSLMTSFARFGKQFILRIHAVADFRILPGGRQLFYKLRPGVSMECLQATLLTQAIPYALTLQGHRVLHASAVKIGSKAVAFVGNHGAGKSTLGAAFVREGFSLVSDDALILTRTSTRRAGFRVLPSFPEVRLDPSTLRRVLPTASEKHCIDAFRKVRAPISDSFSISTPRLCAIYILNGKKDVSAAPRGLQSRARVEISRLPAHEAFVALSKNCLRIELSEPGVLQDEFSFLAKVADTLPVRSLSYPMRLGSLTSIVHAVVSETEDD